MMFNDAVAGDDLIFNNTFNDLLGFLTMEGLILLNIYS